MEEVSITYISTVRESPSKRNGVTIIKTPSPANKKVLCPLCSNPQAYIFEYMVWVDEKGIYKCKSCGEEIDPTQAQAQIQPQQQQQQEQLEPINRPIYRKLKVIPVKVNKNIRYDTTSSQLQNPFDF